MQQTLYRFLITHGELSLPGIGTISIQRQSAQHDFAEKTFLPPSRQFQLDHENDKPSKKLFSWLADIFNISEWDAIKKVNDFSFDLKQSIIASGSVTWQRIGIFKKTLSGKVLLEPVTPELTGDYPVPAEKVIREHASHTILVGETERSSEEMEEMFVEKEHHRDWGWVIAIILVVLGVMFAGWYFSENGVNPSATGNQSVIHPK